MNYTGERLIIGDKECDEKTDIYKEHIERYRFAAELIEQKDKVLDIACGTGYGSHLIAESGAEEVWGGDIDQQAIQLAKGRYSGEDLHFRVMDVTDIPFDNNYFDKVISFETIEHIKDYRKFIKEIARVLKVSGKLILSTPDRRVSNKLSTKNPFHIQEFSQREILSLLKLNFKNIDIYGQRPISQLSFKQKALQKMYFIYRQLKLLSWLKKFISDKYKQKIGDEINGLKKDFKVKLMDKDKDYLYLITVAEK